MHERQRPYGQVSRYDIQKAREKRSGICVFRKQKKEREIVRSEEAICDTYASGRRQRRREVREKVLVRFLKADNSQITLFVLDLAKNGKAVNEHSDQ